MIDPVYPILSSDAMRACDSYTIEKLGVPSQELMERAARAVGSYLLRRRDLFPIGEITVLCGSGNNGGDGFAVARFLTDGSLGEARPVQVIYTGVWGAPHPRYGAYPDRSKMSPECMRQYDLAREAGVRVEEIPEPDPESGRYDAYEDGPTELIGRDELKRMLVGVTCVVDAVFGIGLDRAVEGEIAEVFDVIEELQIPVLAVDIPSGVSADLGEVMGRALRAKATVTMQALNAGHVLYPGAALCGEISVADIGVTTWGVRPYVSYADKMLLRRVLRPRERRSHKGSHGRVLMLCGSVGMCGAAVLAARAALRSGAGLVEVLTAEENRIVLQTAVPEAIVTVYDAAAAGLKTTDARMLERQEALKQKVKQAIEAADVVVAGCGLGTTDASLWMLEVLLEQFPSTGSKPLVLDADAINLTAEHGLLYTLPQQNVIFTPHMGEMARLCGDCTLFQPATAKRVAATPVRAALAFLRTHSIRHRPYAVVLKDAHTVIYGNRCPAQPKSKEELEHEAFICTAGNAGMATGGSGDALAGIIGALMAQTHDRLWDGDLTPAEVAAAGVYLHAAAGDLAAAELGEYGMLPSDLIERLPLITKDLSDTKTHMERLGE